MSPVSQPPTSGGSASPAASGFPDGLGPMRERLDSLSAGVGHGTDAGLLVAELETAYEELRVADEEVRSQQDHIAQLLERENLLRWQHERMLAVLPVPVLTTDRLGVVRAVNAAAAGLFSRRAAHLVGKPLVTLVAADDRPDLRRFLGAAREDGQGLRRVVTLVHRDAGVESVEMQATVLPGSGQISWLVLRSHDPDAPEHAAHRLAPAMVELIGLPTRVEGAGDHAALLRDAVRTCAEALGPGCSVSVNLGPPLDPVAVASSDERAQACDGAQVAAGDGPCHAAYVAGETVVCADVRHDQRWPGFAARAPEGLRSVVAAATEVGGERSGALNVYRDEPDPSDGFVEGVELLAATIGSALYEVGLRQELARMAGDMDRALASRATIDQAKGIVMAARRCTAEEAFAHLVDLASTQHLKLRDLAARIVADAARS